MYVCTVIRFTLGQYNEYVKKRTNERENLIDCKL